MESPRIEKRRPIDFHAIGRIRTPFQDAAGTPIQPLYAQGAKGQVVLDEAFAPGLDDVDGFERIWLVYWMHRAGPVRLRVVPYRDTHEHGLFATRSPCRPNPIGMSVVRLARREGSILHVLDVDMLDDTPLLDIKPYVLEFDAHAWSKAGWFEHCAVDRRVADDRFDGAATTASPENAVHRRELASKPGVEQQPEPGSGSLPQRNEAMSDQPSEACPWNPDRSRDQRMREILGAARVVAVVGMSPKRDRPSNYVARYLRDRGFTIIAVNPTVGEVEGLKAYPDLRSIPKGRESSSSSYLSLQSARCRWWSKRQRSAPRSSGSSLGRSTRHPKSAHESSGSSWFQACV